MSFINPLLLFGGLLFAVPLIIHLLNRQRYKRRPWAAMEFLLRAYKKQRRRLRRENLLLLLLRCLIPLCLALAIARPRFQDPSTANFSGGSAHHLLVIDHSYSMGAELPGARSPFERAKFLASQLIDRASGRDGQKFTLLLAGIHPKTLAREELNLERIKAIVAALPPPVDSASSMTETLIRAAEIVEESTESDLQVYLFSDLQVHAFGEDLFASAQKASNTREADNRDPPALATETGNEDREQISSLFEDDAKDAIVRIREKAPLLMIDVRDTGSGISSGEGGQEDNLQITELRLGTNHAIARVPTPVLVKLLNRSSGSEVVQVTLEIDGDQPRRETTTLEAGAEGEVQFMVTFNEIGKRRLQASLQEDSLSADNQRYLVVPVRNRLRVLLVEGSEETDSSLRDTTLLRDILDPTAGEGAPDLTVFTPKVIESFQFLGGRENLENYELIVLANVELLNTNAAAALVAAVDQGTGLLVMFGPRCNPESYNRFLHDIDDPLMPMRLTAATGYEPGSDRYFGSEIRHPEHPIFADFTDEVYLELFESLPIYRFIGTDRNSLESDAGMAYSEVLINVRDPELSPLLVSKLYGSGKALFLTSALSRHPDRWNRLEFQLGAQASYLFLFLHPLAYWLTLPTDDPFNVAVGSTLMTVLDHRPIDLAVILPERAAQTKVPIGDDPVPLLDDRYALPPYRQTDHAGFYQMEMLLDISGGNQPHFELFAVNIDPIEGDLTYFSHQMAKASLGIEQILSGLPAAGKTLAATSSELGPTLLWLVLLILVGEAALARWVSRRRS